MSLKYVNPEALNENIVKTKEHVETVRQGLDSAKQNKMQFSTMPTASADNLGLIVIYTGATSGSYTHGYVYECVSDGQDPATYSWVETPVQDEVAVDGITITRDQSTGQLSAVPATNSSKGIVQHGDGTEIGPDGEVNVVARLVVTSTMPAASEQLLGATRLFIGTSATYRTGGIYQCQSDGETTPTYSWVLISTAEVDLSDYRKTFLGTTAEWNAKTTAQKTVYDEADITDDLGGGMVVSTVPAEGDHNPIESEAVYNLGQELEDKADKVSSATDGNFAGLDANGNLTDSGSKASDFANAAEITGLLDNLEVNGAVNMLPNNATSQVINGITFTVNDDGTITVNGTASANTSFIIVMGNNFPKQSGGTYTLSGCPSGGSYGSYRIRGQFKDSSGNWKFLEDYGRKSTNTYADEIYIPSENSVYIEIWSGITLNNAIFKPMLTVASYNGEYVPYAKSNRELTESHQWRLIDTVSPTDTKVSGTINIYKNDFLKRIHISADSMEVTSELSAGYSFAWLNNANLIIPPFFTRMLYLAKTPNGVYIPIMISKNNTNNICAITPSQALPIGTTFNIQLEYSY